MSWLLILFGLLALVSDATPITEYCENALIELVEETPSFLPSYIAYQTAQISNILTVVHLTVGTTKNDNDRLTADYADCADSK